MPRHIIDRSRNAATPSRMRHFLHIDRAEIRPLRVTQLWQRRAAAPATSNLRLREFLRIERRRLS